MANWKLQRVVKNILMLLFFSFSFPLFTSLDPNSILTLSRCVVVVVFGIIKFFINWKCKDKNRETINKHKATTSEMKSPSVSAQNRLSVDIRTLFVISNYDRVWPFCWYMHSTSEPSKSCHEEVENNNIKSADSQLTKNSLFSFFLGVKLIVSLIRSSQSPTTAVVRRNRV